MQSKATSVAGYLAGLPTERRKTIAALRARILKQLPKGYEEAMAGGMIVYQVPLKVCPDTYNSQPLMYLALGSQKRHLALYLTTAYAVPAVKAALVAGFKAAGKKPDMGKSCIRFQTLDDLPLDVIGRIIAAVPMADFVKKVQSVHAGRK